MIPPIFLNHAADVLGDTSGGLSGSRIASICAAYAVEYNVNIPYASYPFPRGLANKRTALMDNLRAFSPEQQFKIIRDICDMDVFASSAAVRDLKIKLISRYGHLSPEGSADDINETLIEETRHWLNDYPEALKLYEDALHKYDNKLFQRNLLDDLRLALEMLFKQILQNDKSLENQLSHIGAFLRDRSVSREMANMFVKLVDYYSKYHNEHVKHNSAVNETEIEMVIEMTSSFMKFIIKLKMVG
jgi:hypothetical protein